MKKIIFWVIAVIITIASAYYQRKTGPTYPKKTQVKLNSSLIDFNLPRSGDSNENFKLNIPLIDTTFIAKLNYRRFPVNESFKSIKFEKQGNELIAFLPKQPPAGKLEYYISFKKKQTEKAQNTEHVIMRFKGTVPNGVLIPHILFIFIAMLFSNIAGILAIGQSERHVFYGKLALLFLLLGGMIFGPIVQYYAFGQAWTGIPFGWDLTDNKTLIAFIFWLVAVFSNRKNPRYRYTLIASVITLVIFSIPHSMFGSELDYSSGEVVTGFISVLF